MHCKKAKFAVFFLLTFSSAYAQIPTSGLVAHWPFNGNANDVSGNGLHGNPNNVTSVPGKLGIPNTAYLFNSATSVIGVPYNGAMNVTTITLCAVFKPTVLYTNTCQGNYILARGPQGSSGNYLITFFDNAYNSCSVFDTNSYVAGPQAGPTVLTASSWQTSSKIHTGNWYCMVMTYDGTTARVYINGALDLTKTGWSPTIGSSSDSICIGKYPWGGSLYPYNFTGVLDDIAIYNRVLTPAEVLTYCNNAIAPPDTTVSISQPLNKTSFCHGDTVHVKYQVTQPFNTGNVFTAELSNSTGSFASPVAIGSVTAVTSGTIICTIPAGTPAGTGYRVRIVASSPSKTSLANGVNLTVNPKPTTVTTNNTPVCAGDTIKLTAIYGTTGTTYNWTGPASYTYSGANVTRPNATTTIGGTYTVITTANGCKDTSTLSVTVNPKPTLSVTGNSNVCFNGTIVINASATPSTSSYSWAGPNSFTSSLPSVNIPNATSFYSGKYVVTATLATGCSQKDSVNVTVTVNPTTFITTNSPVCEGDTIKLTATSASGTVFTWLGPNAYSYSGPNAIRNYASASMGGLYTVIANYIGCNDTLTTSVVVNSKPSLSITHNSPVCAGDTIQLTVNSTPVAGTYSWTGPGFSSSAQSVNILNANPGKSGKYIVTATLVNGCSAKDTADIIVTDMTVNLGNDFSMCNNTQTVSLDIPGATYLWQDGSTGNSYHVTATGTYYVTVSLNGCSKSDTINAKITYVDMSLGNDTNLCPGTIFPLMVTDTFDAYEWNTGNTNNTINVNKQGMYWLQVNKYNCIIKDTIQVNYFNPYFFLGNDTLLCNGKYVNVSAQSLEGSTYSWQDGHPGPSYTIRQPGRYWVKAENECGTYMDTISVNFEECDCRPYIPSAFSPNGDGLNDEIKPIVHCTVTDYRFIITNRWGNIVFQTSNPSDKWNGTYKGRDAELGTYFYYCILVGPKGAEYSIKGDITLVR